MLAAIIVSLVEKECNILQREGRKGRKEGREERGEREGEGRK